MEKSIEIQSPNEVVIDVEYINIFLGGSIEMGKAEEWQKNVIEKLSDKPIRFLNPRRDDWDSTWADKSDKLVEQIVWELSAMEMAHIIIMYFDPNTKSPISLLELGLNAREQKLVVLCPEGYWKKDNVDVTCEYYSINQVDTFDELIEFISSNV
jgi:hypothetical protein